MMKQMKKALALWIALALALPMFALAEDGAGDLAVEIVDSAADIAGAGVEGGDEVVAAGVEPEALPGEEIVAPGLDATGADEADSADLGALLDDGDDSGDEETSSVSPAGETASPTGEAFGDAENEAQKPSPGGEGGAVAPDEVSNDTTPAEAGNESFTVTWCFIVDWTLYAQQEAKEGEEIVCPDAPVAPEGMAFAGWFLEDGTQLFVDADGDGEIDPIIAHVDPLCPEVNVYARFEDQKPSPLGKVDQPEAGTDEVVESEDGAEISEGDDEGTSSVTADAATEGAYRTRTPNADALGPIAHGRARLAENSPQESFPGAATSAEGEGNGDVSDDAATESREEDKADESMEGDSLRHGDAVTPPSEREAFGDDGDAEDKGDILDVEEATTNGSLPEGAGSAEAETEGVDSDAEEIDETNDNVTDDEATSSVSPAGETASPQGEAIGNESAEQNDGVDAAATDANPGALTLKKTAITLRAGKTAKISASVAKVKKGKLSNHVAKLRYISDNPAVATVSAKGKIKAEGAGVCTIYVLTTNGIWKAVTVMVDAGPTKIKLVKPVKTMQVGQAQDLGAKVVLTTPAKAQTALSWTSSRPEVASVDASGVVRAVSKGKTVITVVTSNGKKATVTIRVK